MKLHDKGKSKKNWEMAPPEEVYVYITSSDRPLTNCSVSNSKPNISLLDFRCSFNFTEQWDMTNFVLM